jgi:hypothetical protein
MTAGERVGPFEVESKLVEHEAVAEADPSLTNCLILCFNSSDGS